MSHTHSRSWASPETKETEHFQVTKNAMRRLFPKSQVAEMEMSTWLEHRQAIVSAKGRRIVRVLELKEDARKRGLPPLRPPFKGKDFKENRGTVLCQQTIWCSKWDPKKDRSPWPSNAEMKWEGDDRAKTSVGRFLPLPREPGNATVAWHHLHALPQYELDEVRKIPTLEDILLPVDEIDDEKVPDLINTDLLQSIDSDDLF